MKMFNLKFKIGNLKFAFASIIFLFYAANADAGSIIQAPTYLGLSSGLVGSWTFNAPDMSGVTAFDRSGNNNNGTLANGPARAIGRIGQALNFDGSDDYVNLGNPTSLQITGNLTISAWVKMAAELPVDGAYMIVAKDKNTGGRAYTFDIFNGSVGCPVPSTKCFRLYINGGTGSNIVRSVTIPNINVWYHVVGTYSTAGILTLYINGIQDARQTGADTSIPSATANVLIGQREYVGFFNPMSGLIDEVRIYNRVLTSDEIKRLYKIGGTFKINATRKDTLTSGLVGHWTFDEPDLANVTAFDRSGQGNNGTLTNGPARTIGKIGQGLKFDGTSSYVDTSATAFNFERTDKFSFSLWYKSNGTPAISRSFVGNIGVSTLVGYIFGFNGAGVCSSATRIGFGLAGIAGENWLTVCTTNPAPYSGWHHAVVTYDGSSSASGVKIFIDGINTDVSTLFDNLSISTVTNAIMRIGDDRTSDYFNGTIDEVRVYNRALSPDEIKRLYNMGGTFKINATRKDTLTSGLVGHWTFDEPDLANVTAFDRSGGANNGTLTSGPTRAIGKIGQALNFDGVDDLVNAGASDTLLQEDKPLTVSAWIYARTLGETNAGKIIFRRNESSPAGGVSLNLASTNAIQFNVGGGTSLNRVSSNNSIALGGWQHVLVTWDGTVTAANVHIYVNGVETSYQTTTDGSLLADTFTFDSQIGSNVGITTFNGLIDEARIYNRALSPDEIKRLYNMGR